MATSIEDKKYDFVKRMIKLNRTIQTSINEIIPQFCDLQKRFARDVASVYNHLDTIKDVVTIFLDEEKLAILKEFKAMEKIELLVCGNKSCGKTSFIQYLLQCGRFLPIGIGNVIQRNVKFSYASKEHACLLVRGSGTNFSSISDRIELSQFFQTDSPSNELMNAIQHYLIRQDDAIQSETWASCLVEIFIPSPFLKFNIDVYDIVGSIDPKSLQTTRPCFLFLYEGETIWDDTQQYYEELKLSIRHIKNAGIFFLNTKVDTNEIERNRRYEFLKNVPTMNNGLPLTAAECDCFDIFNIDACQNPLNATMKESVIDRIVCFASEHLLCHTQQVSSIMLNAIDAFFDFVLITNRRSTNEWNHLRDEALLWANEFFQQYRAQIDRIGDEAQKQLLIQFRQQSESLVKKILSHRKERYQQFYSPSSSLSLVDTIKPIKISHEKRFLELIIKEEIIRPVLSKIFDEITDHVNEQVDQNLLVKRSTRKNELIRAAYREFLDNIHIVNNKPRRDYVNKKSFKEILIGISGFMNTLGTIFSITELAVDEGDRQNTSKQEINHDLIVIDNYLTTIGERIKENIRSRLGENETHFKEKIRAYHKIVLGTMDRRQQAYRLARAFAAEFARIECHLVANLDLIKHHGTTPTIDFHTALGHGGFFSVHPASWDSENNLVAKVLLNPTTQADSAYMEAHFHRTITRLNIEHMVPLSYLYFDKGRERLYILLPRYSKSLFKYLTDHMATVTMKDAVRIALHISRTVAHMHAQNLIHRDIKVENVLLDNDNNVFLADFGTCQHGATNVTLIGSLPVAPEMVTDRQRSDFSYEGTAVDVFSLGTLMYAVAPKGAFYRPLTGVNTADINALINVPQSYKTLIRRCIATSPKLRPTAAKVVQVLEIITDQVAQPKECLMCYERPIYARCLPCGHKTLCEVCISSLQKHAASSILPQCILCQQPVTRLQEDIDNDTFIEVRPPSQ